MERLEVLKTYKIYIGGKFPQTESGRFYSPEPAGKSLGNICLCSRKDVRNSVVAARAAQSGWAARTAYNSEATAVAARKARSRDMRKSTDGAPSGAPGARPPGVKSGVSAVNACEIPYHLVCL